MTAKSIARALGGRNAGLGWMARCPAHDDREPSLSVCDTDDGKVLVRCHAGCNQSDVIEALSDQGLWNHRGSHGLGNARSRSRPTTREQAADTVRSRVALALWHGSGPAAGTHAETYLRSRGLVLPPPVTVRFHPSLQHPSGVYWPAMVALVTRGCDATPQAIHRTFLARDGGGKAPVDPAKMMLGPCRGGAVRLGEPRETLMVGEGIETCLAAMQATGYTAWAALSASGLRTLDLPEITREVIVLADGDDPGEAAARNCALRWKGQSRRVRIARPPRGMDFNDLLLGTVSGIEGSQR